MAEKVQFNMEKQVAELRDLKERELFDSEELSAIVSRRTALETALHARTVQPKDFLNYVDYERRLDELRGIRAKKQHTQQLQQAKAAKGKGKKVKKQHSLSDYSMARRQTRLLQMGCRRFPTDQILWDRLLAHLYSIKPFPETDVSKTLMSAVAAMPLSHKYWTLAARFQDRSGDTAAARKMFMRAIRVCGHSIEMWETWLLFEVSVAQKLRERWILLGLIKEDQVANDEPPGTTPEGKISLDVESEDPQPPPEAQQENAVLQGQIAKVVIDHALQRTFLLSSLPRFC